jgi:hypothetical protein
MPPGAHRAKDGSPMRRGGVNFLCGLLIWVAALDPAHAQVGFDRLGGD